MSDGMGKFLNEHTVRMERLLPGPIDKVWRHLTTSDGLAGWLCDNTRVESEVGGRLEIRFMESGPDKDTFIVRGLITKLDPPHTFAYSWNETVWDLTSFVQFELEEEGDKVRLTVTHSRLSRDFMPKVAAGWHAHFEVLTAMLNGREPFDHVPLYAELLKKYSAIFAVTFALSSAVSPALAMPGDEAYKILRDRRQALLVQYDRSWQEIDDLRRDIDNLKRDTRQNSDRDVQDLERVLDSKYRDLKRTEQEVRDLDKSLI